MKIRLSNRVFLLAGFLMLAGIAALSAGFAIREERCALAVQKTFETSAEIAGLLSTLRAAESGQRAYLLTGKKQYLDLYNHSTAALPAEQQRLAKLLADEHDTQDLNQLQTLLSGISDWLNAALIAYQRGDTAGAVLIVRTDTYARPTRSAMRTIAMMQAEQRQRLQGLQHEQALNALLLQIAAMLVVLAALMLAFYAIRSNRLQTAELLSAQEQLRQSQKMEVIGQLTGGIAHDFNNLLTIILGSLELLQRGAGNSDEKFNRRIEIAVEGARRATALTHRLLAFARRQPLEPKPIEPNRLIGEMEQMLHPILGERVALEIIRGAGLWTVLADAPQLENAILNLAVNARDAMPAGGRLIIETYNATLDAYAARQAEVTPGDYVVIAVTDTGIGMTAEIRARVFEPFFTTKGEGQGTGLGLAQVYGFIKQSNGHVTVRSEPGRGTTVRLYLPRLRGAAP